MMITRKEFIQKIHDFLEEYRIPPTRFGREACNNGKIVGFLDQGKNISLDNIEKIERYMDKIIRGAAEEKEEVKDVRTIL